MMIIEMTGEDFASLLRGEAPRDLTLADTAVAPPEILEMLRGVAAKVGARFTPSAWMIAEDGELAGMCSVVAVSDDGAIDIGYGVAPSRRGRGVAARGVRDIVRWAEGDPRVTAITAETNPDNTPSRRVLTGNGFVQTGERVDEEDGLVLCFRRVT